MLLFHPRELNKNGCRLLKHRRGKHTGEVNKVLQSLASGIVKSIDAGTASSVVLKELEVMLIENGE